MATVTVEDIEPSAEAPAPEAPEVEQPPTEEAKEEAPEEAPAPPELTRTVTVEPPAPKKRGRPKKEAAPKAEPPKPRGRPKKEAVAEVTVEAERPPPTEEEIQEYLRPLLHAYAAHAQMRGREAKRQHYRQLFSRAF